MDDARETLAAALHPQPGQLDLRQFGVEIALRGNKNLGLGGAYCRLVRLRVAKRHDATPSHGCMSPSYLWKSIDLGREPGPDIPAETGQRVCNGLPDQDQSGRWQITDSDVETAP